MTTTTLASVPSTPAAGAQAGRRWRRPHFDRYVSAQLHCHSSIEGPASIGAHCFEAKRAGVEVVWITDHDTRISLDIGGPFVDRFDFEDPEIWSSVLRCRAGGREGRIGVGWEVSHQDPGFDGGASLTTETCYRGTQSLCLQGKVNPDAPAHVPTTGPATDQDDWQYLMLDFKADSKMHSRPLFSGAKLGIAVRLDDATTHDAEAWLDLTLTEQPPDLKLSRLRYLLWGDPAAHVLHPRRDELRHRVRPLPLKSAPGAWTRHEIDPPRDADATALDGQHLGGTDNAMTGVRLTLRVRRAGRLLLHVDDLTIAHEVAGNDLRARQRVLAGELAARHGVVCHIAQEISRAGQHKNVWGTGVPLLDYASARGGFTHDQGVQWARKHGGVFSLNHPFSKYNRVELDDPQRELLLEEMIQTYVDSGASGADTLEVGFPAGRHNFTLDHYLRLWDGLSRAGVVIAGSGSSDAHSARVGWQNGNNFATHIRADTTDEAALLTGLRARDLYPADPVRFRSKLSFTDDAGHRMGEVVPVRAAEEHEARLSLDRARPSWHLVWVLNGERRPAVRLPEGAVTETLRFDTRADVPTWVRAEIWDPGHAPDGTALETPAANPLQGRCIAFTNPIWYLPGR